MPTARPGRSIARRSIILLGVALALALAACSGSATPAPSDAPEPTATAAASVTTAPDPSPSAAPATSPAATPAPGGGVIGGTGTVSVPDVGLTLTLPDGWQAVPLTADGLAAILDTLPPGSQVAEILGQQGGSLALAGVRLWAFDVDAAQRGDPFAANLNVIAQPAPAGLTIDLLGSLAEVQLQALEGTSDVEVESIDLPAGPAVRATYRLQQALADGTTADVVGRQYYLVGGERLLILTCSGATTDAAALEATFDATARSIDLDGS
jgi:hypothetical protein